jgi:WhiB family transcriptional regulator, redox-sensing transcriptional regulator
MTTTTTDFRALTGSYTIDPAHSRSGFVARHTISPRVRGAFNVFQDTAVIDGSLEAKPDLIGLDPISSSTPDLPCRVHDPDLWFAESPAELELAKAFCARCPARAACLADALERCEPWGVWGGEIFERGQIVARKRPRGRPRKIDREIAA